MFGPQQSTVFELKLDGQPCRALVDIGSIISLVRPGILLDTTGPLPMAWSLANTQVMTVRVEKAGISGKKSLRAWAGDQEIEHEFSRTNIPCIIGLDLLTCLGARVDMAGGNQHPQHRDHGTPVCKSDTELRRVCKYQGKSVIPTDEVRVLWENNYFSKRCPV
ncbi:hypothetical protein GJAV_G00097760 [Gymnothorax javanicus]|nr:hypothetical protein GJAV_G00097760 [Gymnothorax javanicus]